MREFKSFMKTVGGNEGGKCHYPTRLDTYGCGCQHDCSYCYAKSLLAFRKMWHPEDPSVADPVRIDSCVKRIAKEHPGTVVRLGGMTDCFQPAEQRNRVTLLTLGILNKYKVEYLIVTKSHTVSDPEYVALLDKDLAHIQVTVTSTSDARAREYEHASPPSRRIEAVERLQTLGYDVTLRLSPYIDGFIDFGILNAVKCDKILVEFLRVNAWIRRWFDIDYTPYTVHQGQYSYPSLEYKMAVLRQITGFSQVTVCEDETTAYNYFRDNFNPNPHDCCNLRRRAAR